MDMTLTCLNHEYCVRMTLMTDDDEHLCQITGSLIFFKKLKVQSCGHKNLRRANLQKKHDNFALNIKIISQLNLVHVWILGQFWIIWQQ